MADAEEIAVVVEPELDQIDTDNKQRPRDPETGKFVKADEAAAVEELKSQYAELQQESEREKTARLDADRRASEARAEADRARREVETAHSRVAESELDTITQGLAAAQTEGNAAEQAYAAAMEAGNWLDAAKAQRRMSSAEAHTVRLNEAKADLEARKAEPGKQAERRGETARPRASDDPVETFIEKFSSKSADWLRAHREFVTDAKKNAKLTAAHHDALAEGLSADTPDYFAHIEQFVGLKQADAKAANGSGNGATKPRRASPSAAPVGHAGGGTSGSSGTEVRLSASEAKAAQDGTIVWNYDDPSPQKRFKKGDAVGVQEFARRKLELQKQGAYDRTYTDSQ